MTKKLESLLDELRGAWRYRWLALLSAVGVAVIGWLLIFAMPDRYEAQAEILVDTRTALSPVLEGLATNQDVAVQLNYVRQALLAKPQLTRLAEQVGILPASGMSPADREGVLDALTKRIVLTVERTPDQGVGSNPNNPASTTYGISYQDEDRGRALKVVRLLMSSLVNETLGGSQQGSQRAQDFLKAQIADYQKRLQSAEDRLAAFKSQHMGLLTSQNGGYYEQLDRETQAISDVNTKLVVADTQRKELLAQLHGDAAISAADAAPVFGPNGTVVAGDTLTQIQLEQAHLNELLLKYTDKYPDVIAAKQNLAALQRRRAQEIAALRRGDADAAALSGASSNPIYQSIRLALNKADVNIAELRAELNEHQRKVDELTHLLNTTPELEAQYAQLSRDYEINKSQYTKLLASYDKARLGERAGNAGAVRFALVQPPAVSYAPVAPQRGKLLTVVLILALGAGGVIGYALNQMHPVVGSPTALRQLTGIPVVAVVGSAFPTRSALSARGEIRRFSIALTCLILGFVVVLVLSYFGIRLSGIPGTPVVNA
ncbi:MAG TPA: XrtA system polysaccharide chain length determinant [Steroidobacteraceae bacterium]|nr:XrtA system polysaccharide chain length determinant [Steroidobacteraceae bacterium]